MMAIIMKTSASGAVRADDPGGSPDLVLAPQFRATMVIRLADVVGIGFTFMLSTQTMISTAAGWQTSSGGTALSCHELYSAT